MNNHQRTTVGCAGCACDRWMMATVIVTFLLIAGCQFDSSARDRINQQNTDAGGDLIEIRGEPDAGKPDVADVTADPTLDAEGDMGGEPDVVVDAHFDVVPDTTELDVVDATVDATPDASDEPDVVVDATPDADDLTLEVSDILDVFADPDAVADVTPEVRDEPDLLNEPDAEDEPDAVPCDCTDPACDEEPECELTLESGTWVQCYGIGNPDIGTGPGVRVSRQAPFLPADFSSLCLATWGSGTGLCLDEVICLVCTGDGVGCATGRGEPFAYSQIVRGFDRDPSSYGTGVGWLSRDYVCRDVVDRDGFACVE